MNRKLASTAGAACVTLALLCGCDAAQSQNYTTEAPATTEQSASAEKNEATSTDSLTAADATASFDDLSLSYPATWTKSVVTDDVWDITSEDGALLRVAEVEAPSAESAKDAADTLLAAAGRGSGITMGDVSHDAAGSGTVAYAPVEASVQDSTYKGVVAAVCDSDGLYLVVCVAPQDAYADLSGTIDAVIASISLSGDGTEAAPEASYQFDDGNFVVGVGMNAGTYTLAATEDAHDGGYMVFENVCAPDAFLTDSGTGTRTIDFVDGQFVSLVDFAATR